MAHDFLVVGLCCLLNLPDLLHALLAIALRLHQSRDCRIVHLHLMVSGGVGLFCALIRPRDLVVDLLQVPLLLLIALVEPIHRYFERVQVP